MAAWARLGFSGKGHTIMNRARTAVVTVARASGTAPVRVRLKRLNCEDARAYPPDGQARQWWQRLKEALGTSSSDFVNASLVQLTAAARLPRGGISEVAVNAALAFIEGEKP